MRLTLRQLEVFSAICRSGGVTAAADAIGLSQSAASQALAELESALEGPLFDRAGRKLLLNERGHALLPRASELLERAADIEGTLRQHGGAAEVLVRAMPPALPRAALHDAAAEDVCQLVLRVPRVDVGPELRRVALVHEQLPDLERRLRRGLAAAAFLWASHGGRRRRSGVVVVVGGTCACTGEAMQQMDWLGTGYE